MKYFLLFICWFNRKAKNFAIRLVKWTGKHKEYIHPKHLIEDEVHDWFIPFLKHNDEMADLGCGSGSHTIRSASKVKNIIGYDASARNLEIARRMAKSDGLANIKFEELNLEKIIPCAEGTFSVVLALDILEHLYQRDLFLKEMHRILRKDGRLILAVPNSETSWKQLLKKYGLFYYSDLDHKHEYTLKELKALLQQHQFRIEVCDMVVYDTPWVGIFDIIGGISVELYKKITQWKRRYALKNPSESTGFRIVAVKI